MRKNLKAKAFTHCLSVLIVGTYDENGILEAMSNKDLFAVVPHQ